MIPLINHDFQWGRSEVVIFYPDIIYIITYMATLHATDSALVRPLVLTLRLTLQAACSNLINTMSGPKYVYINSINILNSKLKHGFWGGAT